ncbi:MAG: hypothetical protein K0U98_14575 [Deltaproteobacteria bacterium]|nr:hypothetical protein [Deltaproteobacteria bacterium]
MKKWLGLRWRLAILACSICVGLTGLFLAAESGATEVPSRVFRPQTAVDDHSPSVIVNPSNPESGVDPRGVLQIDDGSAESLFGFTGPGTRQFLFFNRFDSPGPFVLEAIQVLFPTGSDVESGDAIELVVYTDPDGDPANGAELRLSFDAVVQATDGVTFSNYALAEPLDLFEDDDIVLGVINRYFETGTDPELSQPAAVDTTNPESSSYFALWAGDAETPPELATAVEISLLDGIVAGNFLIRGSGRAAPIIAVPTLDSAGLILMLLLLAGAGMRLVARRAES